jgi:hypothetical protein
MTADVPRLVGPSTSKRSGVWMRRRSRRRNAVRHTADGSDDARPDVTITGGGSSYDTDLGSGASDHRSSCGTRAPARFASVAGWVDGPPAGTRAHVRTDPALRTLGCCINPGGVHLGCDRDRFRRLHGGAGTSMGSARAPRRRDLARSDAGPEQHRCHNRRRTSRLLRCEPRRLRGHDVRLAASPATWSSVAASRARGGACTQRRDTRALSRREHHSPAVLRAAWLHGRSGTAPGEGRGGADQLQDAKRAAIGRRRLSRASWNNLWAAA